MKKIVLAALFIFALMFSGTSAQAMGGEIHLVGRDGVVTNQIKYTQTLRRGMVNAQVLALQKKLKEFGFYHKALDSDYGSGTIAAVKQFQRAKGLKVDGIAGPRTFAMVLATSGTTLNTGGIKPPFSGDIKFCTKEYNPVCGKITSPHMNESPRLRTYPNRCILEKAGEQVSFLYKGKCKTTKPVDILPINNNFDSPRVSTLSVNAQSHEARGNILDMGDANRVKAFFVVGVDSYYSSVQNIADLFNSFDGILTVGNDMRKIDHVGIFTNEHLFSKEVHFEDNTHYYVNACVEFKDDNGNPHLSCGGAKEFQLPSNNSGNECLRIHPNSSNPVVVVGQRNRQVAEFEIENMCDDKVKLKSIDFKMISSYGKPQILRHPVIEIMWSNGSYRRQGQLETSYNQFIGGKDISINVDNLNYEIDGGDDIDVAVMADIEGVYGPWQFDENKSTAFAISLDDVDYTYNNTSRGWNKRPVWDNLIVVHYR